MVGDEKVSDMVVKLDKISVLDKIHLHRHTDDVLYSYLLKATLKITKLHSFMEKLENQLRQEKVENKVDSVEHKKL